MFLSQHTEASLAWLRLSLLEAEAQFHSITKKSKHHTVGCFSHLAEVCSHRLVYIFISSTGMHSVFQQNKTKKTMHFLARTRRCVIMRVGASGATGTLKLGLWVFNKDSVIFYFLFATLNSMSLNICFAISNFIRIKKHFLIEISMYQWKRHKSQSIFNFENYQQLQKKTRITKFIHFWLITHPVFLVF